MRRARDEAGTYTVELSFPDDGQYSLYAEVSRSDGSDQVNRQDLVVGESNIPRLAIERDLSPKQFFVTRLSIRNAEGLRAGQSQQLVIHADDARTGANVVDLQPYLGAPAHVVVIGEGRTSFAHVHASEPQVPAMTDHAHGDTIVHGIGPDIAFDYTFPAPGLYKIWAQTLDINSNLMTANYTVFVQ